jgi:two-component system LytT family response regulator
MKILIIDDEPGARAALRALVQHDPSGAQVVGEAGSALEAIKLIQRTRPDLVLLDIAMPNGSGFDVVEAFPERGFQLVYTTAHEEHAIRAAHTHPFDYLLKPVDPDDLARVLAEVQRARPRTGPQRIAISSLAGTVYLAVDDILRIEADGGYSTVHTVEGEKHVASRNLGHFEELLPADRFFRCHQSHLVHMRHVRAHVNRDGGLLQLSNGHELPLATRRHTEFEERMGRWQGNA